MSEAPDDGAPAGGGEELPSDALIGEVIAERYRVDGVLGEGGMGAVYRCHHLALDRAVAVKLLHPELLEDDDVSARFEREARSASRLEHPNVMQVLDFGTWTRPAGEGKPAREVKFMVLQLLEGWELADYLGEPMTPERVVVIATQVIRGLEHAHQRGIIHRDLKPENVFVTADHEGAECLKIVDFGLAKVLSGSGAQQKLTRTGMVFGTPQYMSPEQATGMESDERTDIYALGIMMWELLVGRPPFDGDDVVSIIRRQVSTPLPNEELPAETPIALRTLIDAMTTKEVDARIASASDVRSALEAMLRDGVRTPAAAPGQPGRVAVANAATVGSVATDGARARTVHAEGLQSSTAAPMVATPTAKGGGLPKPAIIGMAVAAVFVVAVAIVALTSGDDEPDTASAGADAVAAAEAPPGPMPTEAAFAGKDGGASTAELAALDTTIEALEDAEALTRLDALLGDHPDDARLHVRRGRVLARQEGKERASLEAFDRALELAPELAADDATYRSMLEVLRNPELKSEAVELALARLGERGGPFLVELVNRDDDIASYEDRKRIVAALAKHPDHLANVDRRLNLALDLWQAADTAHGCAVFAKTLDAIEADPHAFFVGSLHKSRAPKATGPEAVSDCKGLNTRRVEMAIAFSTKFPEADKEREVPAAYAKQARSRGGKRSSGGGGSKKKRPLKKLFGG